MNRDDFLKVFADCEICGEKIIIKSKLREALFFLKANYTYSILKEIIAIDRLDNNIELIYHLYSIEDEENLFISIYTKDKIDTVSDIFPSAIADENEIFDLFGIHFIGNNELKRLYMPDGWNGHPLRKNYVQNDVRLEWNDEKRT